MAKVYSDIGAGIEVDDVLLRDFFYETLVKERSLCYVIGEYTKESREALSNYIIHRLAEVSPGYMPANE